MRTPGTTWSWGLVVLTLVLGCTSQEGAAQDKPSKPTRPAAKKPAASKISGKAKPKKSAEDKTKYKATVTDKQLKADQGDKPFVINEAVLFVPEVTLFGGGAGEEVKELKLKRGSAEIKIPFSKIESFVIGKLNEDRLGLTVHLRGTKPGEPPLVGTVKASLELRGKLGSKGLETIVKLRHAKTITISPIK